MGYSERFQQLREARGVTREEVAVRAGCHRNTVLNVEGGRPVKFETILLLMESIGYPRQSLEVRELALLWLESVTGLRIVPADTATLPPGGDGGDAGGSLPAGVAHPRLSRRELDLLAFAARNRKVLKILQAIRDLMVGPGQTDRL